MDSARCPHAPVTLHYRTCGRCRDALPGHYLCFCSDDKCNNALLHRAGGVINPVGPEAHPWSGAPPPSAEPVLERQIGLQFQIRGNNQPSLSILLAARRKARQQGNIDGLVDCLIPLKRLLYDKYKDRAQGG